jgi:hypothetical protein
MTQTSLPQFRGNAFCQMTTVLSNMVSLIKQMRFLSQLQPLHFCRCFVVDPIIGQRPIMGSPTKHGVVSPSLYCIVFQCYRNCVCCQCCVWKIWNK